MKKAIFVMAVGAVAGVMISQIPAVKNALKKGKQKIKSFVE